MFESLKERKVKEFVRRRFKRIKADTSVKEIIKIFATEKVNVLPVFDGDKFIGEIYKIDLLKLLVDVKEIPEEEIVELGYRVDMGYFALKAKDLIEQHGLEVRAGAKIKDVAYEMLRNGFHTAVVRENKKVIGVVRLDDLVKEMRRESKNDRRGNA